MKINFFTNIPSHYRARLWFEILKVKEWEAHFNYGKGSNSSINTIDFESEEFLPYIDRLHLIKNMWLMGRVLIWQKGVITKCIKDDFDQVVFLGEMYCLSTWIAAIICRLRSINVSFWGHGVYGNEGRLKLLIRIFFYCLANKHLLYERRAKRLMIERGFKADNLHVVFNSLDYDSHKNLREKFINNDKYAVFPFFKNSNLPVLIFIGRLTTEKKLHMLLEVVAHMNKDKTNANLLVIGDGVEMANLKEKGRKGLNQEWLHFTGACYDEEIIAKYISLSDLCVSPGNVGLTAIHSLSFGTPIASHNNFYNQGPEVETIIDGFNGFYFKENDINDLKNKIEHWLMQDIDRSEIRERCYEVIDQYYNPYYQISVFKRLFSNLKPEI